MARRRWHALLVLLLLVGCARSTRASPAVPTGLSGLPLQDCARVAQPGRPITARQVADGCVDSAGTVVPIDPYTCRGSGNNVVALPGRRLVGELRGFSPQAQFNEPATTAYGTWTTPNPVLPNGSTDINGCDTAPFEYPSAPPSSTIGGRASVGMGTVGAPPQKATRPFT
jgi:hypothetical protein